MIIDRILNRPTTAQAYADISDYLYEAETVLIGDMVYNSVESQVAQVLDSHDGLLHVVRPDYSNNTWAYGYWLEDHSQVLED